MEIIITAVSAVFCAIAVAVAVFYIRKLQYMREIFISLLDHATDYRINWNSDLSDITFSPSTKQLLVSCGLKNDATYLRSVFGESGNPSETADISLCVNALKERGVLSKYTTDDGTTGVILWKTVVEGTVRGVSRMMSLGRDISDESMARTVMERLRRDLLEELTLMKSSCGGTGVGIFSLVTLADENVIRMSHGMAELFGIPEGQEITLEKFYSLVKKERLLEFQRTFNRFLSGVTDSVSVETMIRNASGMYRRFLVKCCVNREASDYTRARVGVFVDITDVVKTASNVQAMSGVDSVTGLLNRDGFMLSGKSFLEDCRRKERTCAIVCLRVIRLKKIAMLFGMDVADYLARLYADTLRDIFSDSGIVAKIGTEEFTLLFTCVDRAEVDRILKEIGIIVENNCNNHVLPAVLKEQSSFIAGACFYDGFDDIGTLYNKANVTLYNIGTLDGNICAYFDSNIEKKVCDREIIEQEIGDALRQGDLEVYFQPKFSFADNRLVGAEALMRWNHPTQGLIMPGEFIPVAEEVGIITKIDEWGMLRSCIQNKLWQEKGYPPIKISVNMSQAQLYQTDVVASVREALEESGLESQYLEVELTETMAMIDIDRAKSVLTEIRKLGVSISMDDFGTGYSSLSSLKILPIDQLKIDRSLVYDIETNETARHITKAIVDLGKAMNRDLIAEGVETEGQSRILSELGCDTAQGFLYSRPQPAAVIERQFLIPSLHKNITV